MKFKALAIVVLLALLFAGCQPFSEPAITSAPEVSFDWEAGIPLIPGGRTGYSRQGVSNRNFSVNTDTGIYYISTLDPFLLYIDGTSDRMIPVCNRPDCPHAAQNFTDYVSCNAYFPSLYGITCIGDKIFVAHSSATDPLVVTRLDADGANRQTVATMTSLIGAYDALAGVQLWDGILVFGVSSSSGDSGWSDQFYYYKLDGSMQAPQPCPSMGIMGNDAERLIGYSAPDATVHEWVPDAGGIHPLSSNFGFGYYGMEYAIIMEEGRVTKYTYSDQSKQALIDTVFSGNCTVHVFPDCLVVNNKDSSGQHSLYFYNWEFENIGQLLLEFPTQEYPAFLICGETKHSIFLNTDENPLPDYRIDKATLGTQTIRLIALDYPYLPSLDGRD